MMGTPPGSGSGEIREKGNKTMDMNFDVKAKIEELAGKIQKDPALLKKFQGDPIKTVEGLLGVDLPDEKLQPLVTGLKAKLAAGGIGGKLAGLKNLL